MNASATDMFFFPSTHHVDFDGRPASTVDQLKPHYFTCTFRVTACRRYHSIQLALLIQPSNQPSMPRKQKAMLLRLRLNFNDHPTGPWIFCSLEDVLPHRRTGAFCASSPFSWQCDNSGPYKPPVERRLTITASSRFSIGLTASSILFVVPRHLSSVQDYFVGPGRLCGFVRSFCG